MNKTKIILISIGGVAILGALVVGALTYFGISSDSEQSAEDFEYLEDEASRLTRLSVYPGPEAVKATDDNRKAFVEWKDLAMGLASAGDQKFEDTTPASFKAFINEEAKRMADLPGSADGHFVKADFGFGFDEYIHKGKLPAVADLARLQREWNDVSGFLGILIDAKASSVLELQLAKAAVEEENAPKRGKKKAKKADDSSSRPDVTRFNVVFTAGPEALVKVLNDIAANGRFFVAEEMSFVRTPDSIGEKLGVKTVKKQESGRRRRRAAEVKEETPAAEGDAPTGLITDPASADDFKVTMKIAVYDFRTKAKTEPESAKEEQE